MLTDQLQFVVAEAAPMGCSGPPWVRRLLRTKVGHCGAWTETLVRVTVADDGASISGAVLALIPRAVHMPGRHRHRAPSLHRPTRIIYGRCMLITRDFTPNGPIQAGGGGRVLHGGFLRCRASERIGHADPNKSPTLLGSFLPPSR